MERPQRPVEGQGDLAHLPVAPEKPEPADPAVHHVEVQPVPRTLKALDDYRSLGDDLGRRRHGGRGDGSLQDAAARMILVGEQPEHTAVDRNVGDLVLEARHRHPAGLVRRGIGNRRDEHAKLGPHVREHQQRVFGSGKGLNLRQLDALVLDPRVETALHEDRVGGGVGAEAVKARLAVEVALGGVDGARQLVVEEPGAVIEPRGARGFGIGDALGQIAPVGDAEHVQDRVLAAVLRQAVHHVRAVGRGLPPVER